MKNLILAALMMSSLTAFADEFDKLDRGLDTFIADSQELSGVSSEGEKCQVTRYGARVTVRNKGSECLRAEQTGSDKLPSCAADFGYYLRDRELKEFEAGRSSLFAVVKQKDDEVYSSPRTSQIEIQTSGKAVTFKISNGKKLFGGYRLTLDCTVRKK